MSAPHSVLEEVSWEGLKGRHAFFDSSILADILCHRGEAQRPWTDSAVAAFACPLPVHSRLTSEAALLDLVLRVARLLYEGQGQLAQTILDSSQGDINKKIQDFRSATEVVHFDELPPERRRQFFEDIFPPVLDLLVSLAGRLHLSTASLPIFVQNLVHFLKDRDLTEVDVLRAAEICSSGAKIVFTAGPSLLTRECHRAIKDRVENLKIVNTRDLQPPPPSP